MRERAQGYAPQPWASAKRKEKRRNRGRNTIRK